MSCFQVPNSQNAPVQVSLEPPVSLHTLLIACQHALMTPDPTQPAPIVAIQLPTERPQEVVEQVLHILTLVALYLMLEYQPNRPHAPQPPPPANAAAVHPLAQNDSDLEQSDDGEGQTLSLAFQISHAFFSDYICVT
jgi:hypothetical protein